LLPAISLGQSDEAQLSKPNNPRDLLARRGIDESHLRSFIDGRPLHVDEDESLRKILGFMTQFPLQLIHRWESKETRWNELVEHPDLFRTELFVVSGRAQEVETVMLPAEVVQRLEYDRYFRIKFQLDDPPYRVVVCARAVPNAWRVAERKGVPLNERARFSGLFLKVGDTQADLPQLVFATRRVAWHPDRVNKALGITDDDVVLGSLGMDLGQFDRVTDRTGVGIKDRECFYQMLAAVEKTSLAELRRLSPDEHDLDAMLNRPRSQRGRMLKLRGIARWAVKIPVNDADVRERFGINHYYQIVAFIPLEIPVEAKRDKKSEEKGKIFADSYPMVFCVRRLPEGMPAGDDIREEVSIPAFYFKLYAYRSQFMSSEDHNQRQLSPMFIGLEPEWIRPQQTTNPFLGLIFGGLFVITLLGVWLGLWRYSRADRHFERSTLVRQFEVGQDESLDELGLQASDGPDFSGLSEIDGREPTD